jgi:3-hydroxyacyl-[acyl-carrier-protein] dehydratase
MRFSMVDRVLELQPGVCITTVKSLSLAEEYLADHFPRFPVMPGVLMLEAMTQAGAWLVRVSEDFAHSMVVLQEARNVRYKDFVQPGQVLTVTARVLRQTERETHVEAQGCVDDKVAVSGRLILERFNLATERPEMANTDAYVRQKLRNQLAQIWPPDAPRLAEPSGDDAAVAGGAPR